MDSFTECECQETVVHVQVEGSQYWGTDVSGVVSNHHSICVIARLNHKAHSIRDKVFSVEKIGGFC